MKFNKATLIVGILLIVLSFCAGRTYEMINMRVVFPCTMELKDGVNNLISVDGVCNVITGEAHV